MAKYSSRYDEYFQKNKDLQHFWEDTSQQGEFAGGQQGKYYENYGVDAAGAEKAFVEGMNKKFGTSNSDMRDFTKDQFAQYHYDTYGANEGRAMQSAQEFLESQLPKPNNGGNGSTPGTTIGDGNEFGEGKKIGNNVGKDGNINTTIGNDNIFGDNATIGNDYSQTTGNGPRAEAKERVENYQENNNINVGKVGDINTGIGDRNTFGDNATIGNDYSTTIGGGGGNSGNSNSESNYGSRIDAPPGSLFTSDFIDSDKDGVDDRYQRGPGQPRIYPSFSDSDSNSDSNSPANPPSTTVNNNLNVGKRGDINTTIGDNNQFGMGANIGNDYSVTIGGSDKLSGLQGLAAYQALNRNNDGRRRSQFNGLLRSQQTLNQLSNLGTDQMVQNAYNFVGNLAQNAYDKSDIKSAWMFGDHFGDDYNFGWAPLRSPKREESNVQDILDDFK